MIITIVITIALSGISYAQSFLRADGKMIKNGKDKEVILRGIGLGGWMLQEPYMLQLTSVAGTQHDIRNKIEQTIGKENAAAFYDAWLSNHCTKSDIDSLAAWGFNSVRLPMHYNLFTLPVEAEPVAGSNTWINKGFQLTDSLLSWCKANKIYLILDLHAAPGGEGHDAAISDYDTSKPSLWESEANRNKIIALWKNLAQRYVNEEWIGGYDVLNEPNWGFENTADKNGCAEIKNAPLRQLYVDITNAIRSVDNNHLIIIEGNCWGNNYKGIFPFDYPNTVISFHKYWNYNDAASISGILETRNKYNMPVWIGESGENANSWTTQAIKLFEENKIGWAWWPLKKIGFNCPFEVKPGKGYQDLTHYWEGKDVKMTGEKAYKILMELADNLKLRNTVYHKDFPDAMFRQVRTDAVIPFSKNDVSEDAIIFATDYDLGRNGYSYVDNDTANYWVSDGKHVAYNKGKSYRNDGVDIKESADSLTNGYCVSWTEPGEWLQYTVYTKKEGDYQVAINYSAKNDKGSIDVLISDKQVASNIALPAIKDDSGNIYLKNIHLSKGNNRIKIIIEQGGFDLNYLKICKGKA